MAGCNVEARLACCGTSTEHAFRRACIQQPNYSHKAGKPMAASSRDQKQSCLRDNSKAAIARGPIPVFTVLTQPARSDLLYSSGSFCSVFGTLLHSGGMESDLRLWQQLCNIGTPDSR